MVYIRGLATMGKYTLIITEKPDAAQRIASALDAEGKAKKMEDNGVPFYLAERDRDIIVVPAIGHLYTVAEERGGRNYYPVFSFKWVPRYAVERGANKSAHGWKQFQNWQRMLTTLLMHAITT
jgi:DNA topoisomerase IA